MEGLLTLDDRKERRSDVDNSEDERRRLSIGSLKKKALNASNKLTHSLMKRGKERWSIGRRPSELKMSGMSKRSEPSLSSSKNF